MKNSERENEELYFIKKQPKYYYLLLVLIGIYLILMILLFNVFNVIPVVFLFPFSLPIWIVYISLDLIEYRIMLNKDINEENFEKKYKFIVLTASSYQKLASLFFTICFSAIIFLFSFFQEKLQEISIVIIYFVIGFLIFLFIMLLYYHIENNAHEINYYLKSLPLKIDNIITLEILAEILRQMLYLGILLIIGSIFLILTFIIFTTSLSLFGIFSIILYLIIMRIQGRASKRISIRESI